MIKEGIHPHRSLEASMPVPTLSLIAAATLINAATNTICAKRAMTSKL